MVAASSPADAPVSIDFVDRLLLMPDDDKYDLARLLIDSVQQRFTSLAEAEERDRDKIRLRLEEYTSGRVQGIPGAEALADVRATLAEYRALRAKV